MPRLRRAREQLAGRDRGAHLDPSAPRALEPSGARDLGLELERRAGGAQGVVLVGPRDPEDGHQLVARALLDEPPWYSSTSGSAASARAPPVDGLRIEGARKGELREDDRTVAPPLLRGRSAARPAPGVERRVLAEDRLLELAQRGARLDPELLDEHAARLLVRLERLGLPAAAVEREHQLAAEPLAERVLGDQRLELGDEVGVGAERELGVDQILQRRRRELLEPRGLAKRERLEEQVGERRPAPERERLAELSARSSPSALRPSAQPLEAQEVDLVGVGLEQVPARARVTIPGPSARRSCETKFWSEARAVRGGARPRGPRSAHRSRRARPRGAGGRPAAPAASAAAARLAPRDPRPQAGRGCGTP